MIVLPKLTKDYILARVTQEEIMEFYTGIPVIEETLLGNSFCSPFRDDDNPTCNYWYEENSKGEVRLRLKDWDGSVQGDIFDIASYVTKINTKTSQGFRLLLNKVASDFKLHIYTDGEERDKLKETITSYVKDTNVVVIKVIPRKWNSYDRAYWFDALGIGTEALRKGLVFAVDKLSITGKDGYLVNIYNYSVRDVAYAYYGGNVNGINIWKIYFPKRRKGQTRFISNYSFLQGLHLVIPARIGVITKSYKDALLYRMFGIIAIAVPSETYLMTKDEFFTFKINFDIVITNFDYDATGIRLANKYKKVHRCSPLMFTRGRFNQPDFGVKDLSEFRHTFGYDKTSNLIQSLLEKYNNDLTNLNVDLTWLK